MTEPAPTETTQNDPAPVFRGYDDEAARAVRSLREALDEAGQRLQTEEAQR